MRLTLVVAAVAVVAGSCSAAPSNVAPIGPGTTAPVTVDAPVISPPTDLPTLGLQLVTNGLAEPVAMVLRRGDDRLFVAERLGRIMVVEEGALSAEPFLDLSDVVHGPNAEQGLLGLAFHPDGDRLFVLYTDDALDVQIVAYAIADDRVVTDSVTAILTVAQPAKHHQGGGMVFGPDGYLWIGLGDGGGIGDPHGNAQNRASLPGSIVRLDVDAATPYAVPPDNPFVGSDDAANEVWAYGLRNPWRFALDAGAVYIADVGHYEREEINVVPMAASGSNFGWPIREGDVCFEADECETEGLVDPTVALPHHRLCAIVGGPVYRGDAIPELYGQYFYGDYCVGWVRSLLFDGEKVIAEHDWETDLGSPGQITTFGVDPDGEILLATQGGEVYRIVAVP